jgi:hypothetical protein
MRHADELPREFGEAAGTVDLYAEVGAVVQHAMEVVARHAQVAAA